MNIENHEALRSLIPQQARDHSSQASLTAACRTVLPGITEIRNQQCGPLCPIFDEELRERDQIE